MPRSRDCEKTGVQRTEQDHLRNDTTTQDAMKCMRKTEAVSKSWLSQRSLVLLFLPSSFALFEKVEHVPDSKCGYHERGTDCQIRLQSIRLEILFVSAMTIVRPMNNVGAHECLDRIIRHSQRSGSLLSSSLVWAIRVLMQAWEVAPGNCLPRK